MNTRSMSLKLTAVLLLTLTAAAHASDMTVLASDAVKSSLQQLLPGAQQATGQKISLTFGTSSDLQKRIAMGAAFEVAILTDAAIDDLINRGRIAAQPRAELARSVIGVVIRKGRTKPDIGSIEAFKQTLLEARSVGFVEQGASGSYLKSLFQRLGIADRLKPKLKMVPAGLGAADAVSNGDIDIGFTQISEILSHSGVQLLGPLPPEIQLNTDFAFGVSATASRPGAAKALLEFLETPAAASVMKANGLMPRQ